MVLFGDSAHVGVVIKTDVQGGIVDYYGELLMMFLLSH